MDPKFELWYDYILSSLIERLVAKAPLPKGIMYLFQKLCSKELVS